MSTNGQVKAGWQELFGRPLHDLEALWDAVPTEQQEAIKRRYNAALRDKNVSDDAQELQLIDAYLERFRAEGLIPAGDRWLKLSPAMRERLQTGELVAASEEPEKPSGSGRLVGLMLVAMIVVFGVLLVNGLSKRNAEQTVAFDVTFTPTPSATAETAPTQIPTATPLALVDTDRYVDGGDKRRNRDFYPVVLRIAQPESVPRVFVVQERLVDTTEWRYDPNPDVASWLSGMLVHPVLGIPHSADNAQLFASLSLGTTLTLRMNTGAELRFALMERRNVPRAEMAFFDQRSPGIVLLLLGEVDTDGLPTAERLALIGRYLPAQERDALAQTPVLPVSPGAVAQVGDFRAQVSASQRVPQSGEVTLTMPLSADGSVSLEHYGWLLEDGGGMRYHPLDNVPNQMSESLELTLRYHAPTGSDDMRLLAIAPDGSLTRFALHLTTPAPALSAADLDVQLKAVWCDARQIVVEARLYNPHERAITLAESDAWLVLGYAENPVGPRAVPQNFTPLEIGPGRAYDVALAFDWNGVDPYVAFGLAGRRYAATLTQP